VSYVLLITGLRTAEAAELVRERALTEAGHAGLGRLTAVVHPAADVFVAPPVETEPSSTIEAAVQQATQEKP
jgi:hypothetical protein